MININRLKSLKLIVFLLALMLILILFFHSKKHYWVYFEYSDKSSNSLELEEVFNEMKFKKHKYSIIYESPKIKQLKSRKLVRYSFKDDTGNLGYFLDNLSVDYNVIIKVNNWNRSIVVKANKEQINKPDE